MTEYVPEYEDLGPALDAVENEDLGPALDAVENEDTGARSEISPDVPNLEPPSESLSETELAEMGEGDV